MSYLHSRVRSVGYALRGILLILRTQPNSRILLATCIAFAGLGAWLRIDRADWLWLIVAMALIWLAEGLNTGLEFLCDALHPAPHPLIGKAKDAAAGAVLITSLFSLAAAILIFWPHLLK